jgi:RNA polymerase sigma factor (sigma-70 family)
VNDRTDLQLLHAYAEHRSEPAFAELVRRHVDLVHSAAVRMVCDSHLAQDVTQGVFVALAKNAGQLTNRPVLSGWLHRTAQNIAAQTVRSEVRRRVREQEAAAMNELLATEPDVAWEQIAPHLDAALGELGEVDRDALLLRYFERKSAREIAQILGVSDEAAQKRVSRAVERLREFFAQRGITVGAGGLVVILTANVVQAAPLGLGAAITTTAALAGTTIVTTTTATAIKTIAMTTLQKSVIAAALVASLGAAIYEARQAASLQARVQSLQQQKGPSAEMLEQLTRERDEAMKGLVALREEVEQLRKDRSELPKLRGEIARLRNDAQELAKLKVSATNDPTTSEAVSWSDRVTRLKQRLEQNPGARIPELQFTTEQDWLNAARGKLETEKDYRQAMSALRSAGESKFASMLQPALNKYLDANNQQFPTDVSQLQPYFKTPVDDALFQRYAVLPAEAVPNLGMGGNWIITQRSPIDEEYDSRLGIGPSGHGSTGSQAWNDPLAETIKTLDPVMKAYAAANDGRQPGDPAELLPYLKTPEQKAAYDKGLKALKALQDSNNK